MASASTVGLKAKLGIETDSKQVDEEVSGLKEKVSQAAEAEMSVDMETAKNDIKQAIEDATESSSITPSLDLGAGGSDRRRDVPNDLQERMTALGKQGGQPKKMGRSQPQTGVADILGGMQGAGGKFLQVGLSGAVGAGILAAVGKFATEAPRMNKVLQMIYRGIAMFARPFFDLIARFAQGPIEGFLEAGAEFNKLAQDDGLLVALSESAIDVAFGGDGPTPFNLPGLGGVAGAGAGVKGGMRVAGKYGGKLLGKKAGGIAGLFTGGILGGKIGSGTEDLLSGNINPGSVASGGITAGALAYGGKKLRGGVKAARAGISSAGGLMPALKGLTKGGGKKGLVKGAGKMGARIVGGGASGGALWGLTEGIMPLNKMRKGNDPSNFSLPGLAQMAGKRFGSDIPGAEGAANWFRSGNNPAYAAGRRFKRGGLDNIGPDWAKWLNPVNWTDVLNIAWDTYLNPLEWTDAIGSVNWSEWINPLNWGDIFDGLNLKDAIVGAVTGGGGDLAPDLNFASGGLINRPTAAVVGEAGPEVVAPYDEFKQAVQSNRDESSPAGGSGGEDMQALAPKLDEIARLLSNLDPSVELSIDGKTLAEEQAKADSKYRKGRLVSK